MEILFLKNIVYDFFVFFDTYFFSPGANYGRTQQVRKEEPFMQNRENNQNQKERNQNQRENNKQNQQNQNERNQKENRK